jgi:hypothetical protein
LREAINSAALRFVPMDKTEDEGYAEYVAALQKKGVTSTAPFCFTLEAKVADEWPSNPEQ